MINFDNSKVPKILVVGDLMIDQYLWGSTERISPEAPVPIINVKYDNEVLGGAGNVVNNLKKLGAQVDIFSVIGDCKVSSDILSLLSDIRVNTQYLIKQKSRIVSKKTRIIASHQQVVRYDRESKDDISLQTEDKLINSIKNSIDNYDIILLSDYGKGVLTKNVTRALIDLANSKGIKVLVDPKGDDYSKYSGAFLLTPNKKEASEITKIEIKDRKSLLDAAKKLKTDLNLKISLITMSEEGIAVYDEELRIKPTITREVYDVTGAGDTVLSSLGYALALNIKIDDAVEFSNLAAGVVVSKIGSATATFNEIIEHESSLNKSTSDKHIKTFQEISKISSECRIKDRKIVFTNGCFDIIHFGHIKYLETAKSLGDILILGLNSDNSVSSIKGDHRPINMQGDRAYILAALEAVDYVVIFEEDTPYNLIREIKPNILVKGSDYIGKEVVGEDLVEELVLVEFIEGRSSTNIINKLNKVKKA
jgi:D-beta-D-heptose 7-phosphate kinase / D-beta-D-heptose 1-phosphate adenosyltransferase